jgi:hypothetical protein
MPAKKELNTVLSAVTVDMWDKSVNPNQITSIEGKVVSLDDPAIVGCLADHLVSSQLTNNRSGKISGMLLNADASTNGKYNIRRSAAFVTPYVSQNQSMAQVSRYYFLLADAAEKANLRPDQIIGPVGLKSGLKPGVLSRVDVVDPTTGKVIGTQNYQSVNDFRARGEDISRRLEAIKRNSPALPAGMSSTANISYLTEEPKGMGFFPLLLAIPFAYWALMAIVTAGLALGAYSISRVANWWTEHDKLQNAVIQGRLKCYDNTAAAYAASKDPDEQARLREIMNDCSKQAADAEDNMSAIDWKSLIMGGAALIAAYGAFRIYQTYEDHKLTKQAAGGGNIIEAGQQPGFFQKLIGS